MVEEQSKTTLDRILDWLDERLGIYGHTLRQSPRYGFRLDYWLGSFVLGAFVFEVITGMLVAIYYVPGDPYQSTLFLIQNVPYGGLLFSLHSWGAYAMVFLLLVHMTRNFIDGAYRKPRELMWIVGTLLAGLTLTEAFLGYSLPYNLISWTATTTGLNLFTYMPFNLGSLISTFTLLPSLPGIASNVDPLIQRFFVFHWIVGFLIGAVLGLHLYIFEKHGLTPPLTKEPNAPELIDQYPERLRSDPNWRLQPLTRTFGMIVMTMLLIFGSIFLISSMVPFDIQATASGLKYLMPAYNAALAAQTPPIPDWYFLFVYFFFKSVTPTLASDLFLAWAVITALFPFIDQYVFRHKAPHPVMRPAAISLGTGFIVSFVVNSIWADLTPGRDIGPIGVEVDGLIFLLSFAILFPTLRFLQGRSVKGEHLSGGLRRGFTSTKAVDSVQLNESKMKVSPRALIRSLELSAIVLLILITYMTIRLASILAEGGYTTILQFEGGQLIGTDMILAGMLTYIYVTFLGEQR
ncbi:cytochrome b6 [Sulfodiicoccus acidiphilus]|uniref:Cytochrome b6 n=1 Tax=Sulfodiicoccus acidiphilus TaxID=1670455 RepID=A0A348B4A5_9CREN|nr:cytochrome bc complex cytochrome b subunit [Sulfodiicoccus acidiphilus]BBD73007.1 cytochrome b6 [Sulfodiicoccus acidiphilus]GGU04553.1 cytochrome b6 [Sulfodiicoccus acidiphilus]